MNGLYDAPYSVDTVGLALMDSHKMELVTGAGGNALYELLLLARDFEPNQNKDYYAPADAAVAALMGSSLVVDSLLRLAMKTRGILDFLDECRPSMPLICNGETVDWKYRDDILEEEDRRVAWVPSQEYAASVGWRLLLSDHDNASVVSKDLMWLMLRCHKISSPTGNPSTLYSCAIMNYFAVSTVEDYIDPHQVLPDLAREDGPYGGISNMLKDDFDTYSMDTLVAAISNDSWWELYIQSLKNRASREAVYRHISFGYSDAEWLSDLASFLSKGHELRVLDLAETIVMDYEGLADACAYISKGPLLRAALAIPGQKCTIDTYRLKNILYRTDIDRECASALIEYLRRCDPTVLCSAIDSLWTRGKRDYPVLRLSAAAVGVLIWASRGLGIRKSADEYMATLYISSLLHGSLSPCSILPDFADTLSHTHEKAAEELRLAAETLHAAEIYATREDATTAVIENLLCLCPDDQKELSRALLWMMLRGADGRELLSVYIGHASTTEQVKKAIADKRSMVLFGLRFRPWLAGEKRIGRALKRRG